MNDSPYQIMKEFISSLDAYIKQTGSFDWKHFCVWMYKKVSGEDRKHTSSFPVDKCLKDVKETLNDKFDFFFGSPEKLISFTIFRLSRFIRHYTKKQLEDLPVSTIEEFSFLLDVDHRGTPTKNDVVNNSFMEYTTATEIINRLVKLELLVQIPDENDKRVRRLKITDEGKSVGYTAAERMQTVSKVMIGNIENEDKTNLLALLSEMDDFNLEIFKNDKDSSLKDIEEKYLFDHHD